MILKEGSSLFLFCWIFFAEWFVFRGILQHNWQKKIICTFKFQPQMAIKKPKFCSAAFIKTTPYLSLYLCLSHVFYMQIDFQ